MCKEFCKKVRENVGVGALIIGAVVGVGLTASAWMTARAYSKSIQPSSYRSFTVSGEGKTTAVPDIAKFSFSVITEGGKDIGSLQKENTDKTNNAIKFLKENGAEDKDVKTQNYNLSPRYQYHSCPRDGGVCPPPEIVGYTITQNIQVKIRDFAKIGDLVSGVIQKGANSVSELTFDIDDQTKIQDEARSEAIAKAKAKAEMIAKAGGFRIGRLLSISENSYPMPMYTRAYDGYGLGGGVEMAKSAPTIEAGSQEVTANVTLTYEIE